VSGKISADPLVSALDGSEIVPIISGGLNKTTDTDSIANLAGAVTKAAVCALFGWSDIITTDTTITISRLGADLVMRRTIIDLEVPV
jgi:hypothetical protein